MTRYLLLTLLFLSVYTAIAQNTIVGSRHEVRMVDVHAGQFIQLEATNAFTAVAIQAEAGESFENAFLLLGGDTFNLTVDEHAGRPNGRINANLISIPQGKKTAQLFSGQLNGRLWIHFLDGSLEGKISPGQYNNEQKVDCAEPVSIDQSVWRAGLQPPAYVREFNDVEHVIVHHSAGSNTNTNYTQVVRDIYLYHTQVNMWSDIGYNYLIAQDGTIFKGRDPGSGAQDDVRGAHFCGKNSLTMGVCLMGTYTDIAPSQATVASLYDLVSWKLLKEGLDPRDELLHSGSPLGVLAGHRDGCATECPGQKTYDQLNAFRKEIWQRMLDCESGVTLNANFSGSPLEIEAGESVSFYDLSTGDPLHWLWLFEGGTPGVDYRQKPEAVTYYLPGLYDVSLVVSNDTRQDTLTQKNMVRVRRVELPRIYPNPVQRGALATLELDIEEEIRQIYFTDLSGKFISEITDRSDPIVLDLSALSVGSYLLHITETRQEKAILLTVY